MVERISRNGSGLRGRASPGGEGTSEHSRRLEGVVAASMLLSDVSSNAGAVSAGVLMRPAAFGGLTLNALSVPPIA